MELASPKKKLSELINFPIDIFGPVNPTISNLTESSKSVIPGALFFARRGGSYEGSMFINEAIEKGAQAICHSAYDPSLPKEITQLITHDVEEAIGKVASLYYSEPSRHMTCIGVTGTSGKTTVTYILNQMLKALGKKSALIGTTGILYQGEIAEAGLTTLDAITLQKKLFELKHKGCTHVSLEVSSHALDQKRTQGLYFQSRIFTNLSSEHLDYHKTMERYAQAKARLFKLDRDSASSSMISNSDDSYTLDVCKCPSLTYGITSGTVRALNIKMNAHGSRFTLEGPSFGKKEVVLSLIGQFNIYNFLAALSALLDLGYPIDPLIDVAQKLKAPPGRLEPIENSLGISIFVDYAHKPDALEHVLKTLKAHTGGRILLVFGCGGNRDSTKRPQMGRIASALADKVWITNDNPRYEDPEKIALDIKKGCSSGSNEIILDRKEAIIAALKEAKAQDTLLIAGRGHEEYQLIAGERVPFNDREVILKMLPEIQMPASCFES